MRVSKAKLVFVALVLGSSSLGCQIIGGVSSELALLEAPAPDDVLPVRDPLVWEALDPGPTLVYVLPEWLHYANFSDGRTSQVGPSALRLGYALHEARPRDVGKGWGLSIEATRTNMIAQSMWGGSGWVPGSAPNGPMMEVPGQMDPAGGQDAIGMGAEVNQQSKVCHVPDGSVASSWFFVGTGAQAKDPPYAYFVYGSSFVPVTDVVYRRYDVTREPGDPSDVFSLVTTSVADAAPALLGTVGIGAHAPQVEIGKYPSSYIPTNGTPVTRASDILSVDTADLAPSGYFSVKIRYAPHYATGEQQYAHDLLAMEDDGVFLRMNPGGTLILHVTGVEGELRIEGLSWSREQTLEVEAKYLKGRRTLSIVGATTGDAAVTVEGAVPALGKDPLTWMLGDNDGAQESADLRYLEIR